MPKLTLDIIIINWNSGLQLKNCIESLPTKVMLNIDVHIFIVDNASTDLSLSYIPNSSHHINIIKCNKNIGFGKACNLAIKQSTSNYVLFLNPDTLLNDALVLTKSIDFLEANLDTAVLGIKQVNEKGETLRTCARFYSLSNYLNKTIGLSALFPHFFKEAHMSEWDHNNSQFVNHVMGSFYMIRRTILEKVGGFDERYFMYLEDLDLSHKVVKSGEKIYFNAELSLFHEGGGSSKQVKAKRLYYSIFSKYLYFKNHFSGFEFLLSLIFLILIEPIIRLMIAGIRLNKQEFKETYKAYNYFFLTLRSKTDPFKVANS